MIKNNKGEKMKQNYFNTCAQEDEPKFALCPNCTLNERCDIKQRGQVRHQKSVEKNKKKNAPQELAMPMPIH